MCVCGKEKKRRIKERKKIWMNLCQCIKVKDSLFQIFNFELLLYNVCGVCNDW